VVTFIFPDEAPLGTFARICVAVSTVKLDAETPLNWTVVAPVKWLPEIVTSAPTTPLIGVNELMIGVSEKSVALIAVPPPVVTLILPEVAPAGTVARICVFESTVNVDAEVPLNATALAPVKLLPVIVTIVPAAPLVGVKEEIEAPSTVKSFALTTVPPAVVTLILPVEATAGTVARI
jgi:hypothetical protein